MVQAHAEAMLALATKHGFVRFEAQGVFYRGMALAAQGQGAEGISQMQQGLAIVRAVGHAIALPRYLAYLAEAYGQVGQAAEGLHLLAEALYASRLVLRHIHTLGGSNPRLRHDSTPRLPQSLFASI